MYSISVIIRIGKKKFISGAMRMGVQEDQLVAEIALEAPNVYRPIMTKYARDTQVSKRCRAIKLMMRTPDREFPRDATDRYMENLDQFNNSKRVSGLEELELRIYIVQR